MVDVIFFPESAKDRRMMATINCDQLVKCQRQTQETYLIWLCVHNDVRCHKQTAKKVVEKHCKTYGILIHLHTYTP